VGLRDREGGGGGGGGDDDDDNNNNNNKNNSNNGDWNISQSYSTSATYRESTKLRNYRKQSHWALHTNCGKC
jgi:hypothetical protein